MRSEAGMRFEHYYKFSAGLGLLFALPGGESNRCNGKQKIGNTKAAEYGWRYQLEDTSLKAGQVIWQIQVCIRGA